MHTTYSQEVIKKTLEELLSQVPQVHSIVQAIHKEQGKSYLVGGAVRDLVLALPVKDLDIEVHGLSLSAFEDLLKKFGHVNNVGKSFGVLRLEKLAIDWSVPRSDEPGRKPQVTIDPWMDIKKAFERRDLTMNAMGIDLITYELVDPFNGLADIQNKILRTPNPAFFVEDPLRFYRVMQFVARFGMQPDRMLDFVCSTMSIVHISRERIEGECQKWLLRSKKPSRALTWLDAIGRLEEVFPHIAATKDILQEPDWHPEGDVFEHTKQAIDAAALLDYADEHEKLVIMYAVLCHDLGKVVTTKMVKGRLTAYDHAKQGVPLAKALLKRIMRNTMIIDSVCKLVEVHLYPGEFIQGDARSSAYKRLALKLAPEVTIAMVAKVALADKQGRNIKRGTPLHTQDKTIEQFLHKAQQFDVLTAVEQPVLQGRDLMPEVQPGPEMGLLVKEAYAIQLNENIHDKEKLKALVLKKVKKNNE